MRFTNTLKPDDVLKIDTETAEMYFNGQEVYSFSGSMIEVKPNTTTYSYSDRETSRDLDLTLEYQERHE